MTDSPSTDSLQLDERQRAMLKAMGVTVWWPMAMPPEAEIKQTAADYPYSASGIDQKNHKYSPVEPVARAHPQPTPTALATPSTPATPAAPAQTAPSAASPTVAALDGAALQAGIAQCRACGLCEGRTQAVPGTGPQPARWMVVLDAPSEQEDRQGFPVAQPDGPLLRAMLTAMGLDGETEVFITHAVKCRGGAGRNPTPDEVAACRPYLMRQLALVQPAMVLALGRLAAQSLLAADQPALAQLPLGKLRGQVHTVAGVPVVVSYPPQSLLRHPADKAKAWSDLCLAMSHVGHSPLVN